MKAAEWRKRLVFYKGDDMDSVLGDFEAAEVERDAETRCAKQLQQEIKQLIGHASTLVTRADAAEARVRALEQIQQDIIDGALHDVSERCKAAEARAQVWEREIWSLRSELAESVPMERVAGAESECADLTTRLQAEQQRREAAEKIAHEDFLLRVETNQRAEALVEALQKIASHGNHSGVIPCPQDYNFYIKPMQEIAVAALSPQERGREGTPEADVCCHGIAIDEYCDFCHGGEPQAGGKEGR